MANPFGPCEIMFALTVSGTLFSNNGKSFLAKSCLIWCLFYVWLLHHDLYLNIIFQSCK